MLVVDTGAIRPRRASSSPGQLARGVLALATTRAPFPLATGILAFVAPLPLLFAGQIPVGGTLDVPLNIHLPIGLAYALAYEQGLFFSLEDEFVLGTPRARWILAAGL